MGLNAKHPLYTARASEWEQITDTREGERVIKAAGTQYLSATNGMEEDGMQPGEPGYEAYLVYKERAIFPTDVDDAVEGMVGLLHRKPPTIKVPASMEPMLERLTVDGADAETLLRRINDAQLEHGRVGLLLELPDDAPAGTMPFVAIYTAPTIINWNTAPNKEGVDELALVVLDETGAVMKADLTWQDEEQFRVLALDTFVATLSETETPPTNPTYQVGVGEGDTELSALEWTQPSAGGKRLEFIPFVLVNTQDLSADPDKPPLLGLSDICLSIYRSEADYRHALFMQGQETLVITGSEAGNDPGSTHEDRRIGAGAIIELPQGASAEYVGVSADGLTEMREALDGLYDKAAQLGMKLLDVAEGSTQQSGEALRIRVAARTASLTSVSRAGAAALETILRYAAMWLGANPDEVEVIPNPDFADDEMTGKDLLDWVTAKNGGAPISWQTIHDMLREREITQLTFEEEQELIDDEEPPVAAGAPDPEIDPATGLPKPPAEDE